MATQVFLAAHSGLTAGTWPNRRENELVGQRLED